MRSSRFDHLGWWTDSIDTTVDRWSGCTAITLEYDGRVDGRRFAYFEAPAIGARLEIVDVAQRSLFRQTWPSEPAQHISDRLDSTRLDRTT